MSLFFNHTADKNCQLSIIRTENRNYVIKIFKIFQKYSLSTFNI